MKRLISLALCFIMVFTLCQPVLAAGSTITWTGSADDGSWHTVGNWNPAQVPVDGDYVIIPESSVVEYVYDDTSVSLDCAGDLTVSSGALSLTNGNSSLTGGKLDGAGDITITGGSSFLWSGGSIEGSGTFTVNSGAQLNIETDSDVALSRSLLNNGQIMLNEGGLYLTGGSGGTGTIAVSDGAYLEFMQGAYSIDGDFVNGGNLSIWGDSSALFNAGYQQENTGTLALKVWGSGSDEYCKLDVTGEAELEGILEIDFIDEYAPQPGDTFEILTCSSRAGEFSSIINNMEEDGITLVPAYTSTGLTLKAATVWEVANAEELETALNGFQSDDTIKLTADFTYNKGIAIDGKNVTFDTGSFTLNVSSSADSASGIGLEVKNGGNVYLTGSGQLYIRQIGGNTAYGVKTTNGSTAMVTNVQVTVFEDDAAVGAYADGTGSFIHVLGNVHVMGVGGCGAKTVGRGSITVDGTITATIYINIGSTYKDISSGVDDPEKAGYLKYSTDPVTGIVWVKVSPATPTVPTAPQNFTAEPGDGQVALSWTAPESDGGAAISRYEVSRDNGSTWVTASASTSHTFTGLSNGTEYTFKVRAVNSAGSGAEASAAATPTAPEFAGGDGSEEEPYLIETVDQLNNVRNYLGTEHNNKHFKLSANLNLDVAPYNSGDGWEPIGTSTDPFTGTFDGDEYTISGLVINQAGAWDVRVPAGLFGYTGADAEICDLSLEDVDVTGCYYVGGLVGNNSGDISNISGNGNVVGEWDTGGLAGLNNGSITDSAFTGTVTGTDIIEYGDWTGGLVGYNLGTIAYCQTNATVVSEGDSVGGVAGENLTGGIITESCSSGTVTAYDYTGGLAGSNSGQITACYSMYTVNGDSDVGGLVGGNSGQIADSFAAGEVGGTLRIGGLVGSSTDVAVTGCYWDAEASGQSSSAGGTGKTTAEMKQLTTFENWDFITIWDINTGKNDGYPFLRWQFDAPPVLSETGIDSVTDTTATLSFTSDKTGTYYYLVYDAAEDAPDAAAIKAQGEDAAAKGSGAAAAAENAVAVTGLSASTAYNAYIVVECAEGSTSNIAVISFTTQAALTAPDAPQNLTAAPGDGEVELSWTAPASDGGSAILKYQVSKDNGVNWTDVGLSTSYTFTGLTNGTEYTFKVRAFNSVGSGAEASATATPSAPAHTTHTVNFYSDSSLYASKTVNDGSALGANWPDNPTRSRYSFGGWFTGQNGLGIQYTSSTIINADIDLYAKWTYSGGGSDDDSGGGGSSTQSTPPIPATPAYKADIIAGNTTKTTLPVTVGRGTGNVSIEEDPWNTRTQGSTVITMPSIPGIGTYSADISVANLSTTDVQGTLTLNTDTGSITVPSDMLTGVAGINGNRAQIIIGQGDKSNLPKYVRNTIGDRPLVQLTLSIDGQQIDWGNPKAPVTVSIPYTPTAAELANPESIVIWYIDGSGNIVSVPNGRYDPVTGTVTFTATHFSYYAVSYNQVSFKDVANDAWYAKAVSFISAREITAGTGDGNFNPEAKLTRGQFIVMLMKAYGIAPELNTKDNFADAGNTYYTGYLAAAKRLGISSGTGNNMFAPEKEITRQEMFTLLYNALKAIGQLPQGSSGKALSRFIDAGQVASWAQDAMTLLVRTGTVGGSNGAISPLSTTTRAEMAQVLFNLLSK